MKELKWIYESYNNQWISTYRNRFTKENNTFLIMRQPGSYWLVWDSPIRNKTINTFRQLKNAKLVAQLIAFG